MKRVLFLLLVTIGLVAVAGSLATAHKKKVNTQVIIHLEDLPGDDNILGEVKAASTCEKDFKGEAITDQEGDWGIALGENAKKGTYTAVVAKHKVTKKHHVHRCRAAVSNALIAE